MLNALAQYSKAFWVDFCIYRLGAYKLFWLLIFLEGVRGKCCQSECTAGVQVPE